ncbi:MAG: TonB-dependent receptor [Myxococcales bacterium]
MKLAFALAIPLVASAQLKVPDLPAIPTVPALPSVPKLPSIPSVPALPSVPKLPAVPSGLPKLPTAPAPPAASGKPPPAPPPAPPAGAPAPADTSPTSAPQDVDIIVGDKQDEDDSGPTGVPATLPPELRRNLKPGTPTADSAKGLTIEQIVDAPVVSASSRLEGARSAPALVYVLTAKDLRARGYSNLSEMFDDLPEMDVVRPYGDTYYRNYWRGSRIGSGADPYLVMIDGVTMNHLIVRDTQMLSTFPMSSIDHVEIVYGPASALYGANAETGIINIITKNGEEQQKRGETGTFLESRLTFGGSQRNLGNFDDTTKIVDAMALHVARDFRLRLSVRLESGVLDRAVGDRFEYTQDKYYTDPTLWGAVQAALPGLAGGFYSPDRKRAVEARFYAGNLEIGGGYYELNTGFGTHYAGDTFQTQSPWTRSDASIFGRYSAKLSGAVMTTARLSFRDSRVASPSTLVAKMEPGSLLVSVEAPGQSIEVRNDWSVNAARNLILDSDSLDLGFGLKYTHSMLPRDFSYVSVLTYTGTSTQPTDITGQANPQLDGRNRRDFDDIGAYILAKYAFPPSQALHLGVRVDTNSIVNSTDATVRGGYAGTFDRLTLKLLYGQAVSGPSAFDVQQRQQAVWGSAEKSPDLKVERSQTLEANAALTLAPFAFQGDVYYVTYSDPIVDGKNLKDKRIAGGTLGARLLLQPVQVWASYTHYFLAKESNSKGDVVNIGDIAYDKLLAGFSYDRSPFTATVLGRFIGTRQTVLTNPVREVPWYITLDANVVLSHVFFDGLWFALRCTNILDWRYNHPGIGLASSGNTPAYRNAGGLYIGSAGFENSLHPQPGRSFFATLGFDLY